MWYRDSSLSFHYEHLNCFSHNKRPRCASPMTPSLHAMSRCVMPVENTIDVDDRSLQTFYVTDTIDATLIPGHNTETAVWRRGCLCLPLLFISFVRSFFFRFLPNRVELQTLPLRGKVAGVSVQRTRYWKVYFHCCSHLAAFQWHGASASTISVLQRPASLLESCHFTRFPL